MRRTNRIIRSMDGPIRVLGHLMSELRHELDKTAKELQEDFSIFETGVKDNFHAEHPAIVRSTQNTGHKSRRARSTLQSRGAVTTLGTSKP